MEHTELIVRLARNVVHAVVEGAHTPEEALSTLAPEAEDKMLALLTACVAEGFNAGLAHQSPATDRLTILGNMLRSVHAQEQFGDCVNDGDHYPCLTVRALDIVGA